MAGARARVPAGGAKEPLTLVQRSNSLAGAATPAADVHLLCGHGGSGNMVGILLTPVGVKRIHGYVSLRK